MVKLKTHKNTVEVCVRSKLMNEYKGQKAIVEVYLDEE